MKIHDIPFISFLLHNIAWLSSWKSLTGIEWSCDSFGVFRFFLSIRDLATNPPTKLPIIRPNVAEANDTVVAPDTPISSRRGPKEPAVPCPPIIGIEAVQRPRRGSKLNSFAKAAPNVS